MRSRRAIFSLILAAAPLFGRQAHALSEAEQVGDDVRVRIDESGVAEIEDVLRWKAVRGVHKGIELPSLPSAAELDPRAVVRSDLKELTAHATQDAAGLHVSFDDPRAALRGAFSLTLHYRVDLASEKALSFQGAAWRLTYSTLAATSALESVRVTFDLPASETPPRPIVPETGSPDTTAVAALHRQGDRDELELVWPHLTRGESATWTVRLDPHALARVALPGIASLSPRRESEDPSRARGALAMAAAAVLAIVAALLMRRKMSAFEARCRAHDVIASALVPLPKQIRPVAFGVALAAGIALDLADMPTLAGAFIAAATLIGALRPVPGKATARGPARWVALRPEDAFTAPAVAMDPGMALAAAVVGLGAALAGRFGGAPALAALLGAAAAGAPLVLTGSNRQIESTQRSAARGSKWLRRAHRQLRRAPGLRVSPLARVSDRDGERVVQELRLLVQPRAAVPGLVGIELGLAWTSAWAGPAPLPEVLVRLLEGSPAAARLASLLSTQGSVSGRRPGERVIRLAPCTPTLRAWSKLAEELARTLTEQRMTC